MVDLARVFAKGSRGFQNRPASTNLADGGGLVEGAVANVAGKMAGVFDKFARDVKKEETQNFADNNSRKYKLAMDKKLFDAKASGDPTQIEGFMQEFGTFSDELRSKIRESAPHMSAGNAFHASSRSVLDAGMLNAQQHVMDVKLQTQLDGFTEGIDDMKNSAMLNPNPREAQNNFNDYRLQIESSNLMLPAVKKKFADKSRKEVTEGVLTGFERTKQYDAGIKFLNSKSIGEGKNKIPNDLSNKMGSERKRTWITRLEASKDKNSSESDLTLTRLSSSAIIAVEGREQQPGVLDKIYDQVQASGLKEHRKMAISTDLAEAKVTTTITDSFALLPPKKRTTALMNQMISDGEKDFELSNPLMAGAYTAKVKKDVATFVKTMDASIKKDPVAYFTKYDKELKTLSEAIFSGDGETFDKYQDKMDTYFNMWEVPEHERRYFTKPVNDNFSKNIKGFIQAGEHTKAVDQFWKIKKMTGDQYYQVLTDMGLGDYAVIGETATQQDAMRLLQNADKDTSALIDKHYKLKGKGVTEENKALLKIGEDDLYKAYMLQDGGSETSRGNAGAIAKHVLKDYKRLTGQTDLNQEGAIKEAWKMFSNNHTAMEFENSHILIPSNYDSNLVKNSMDYSSEQWAGNLEHMDIKTDPKYDREVQLEHVRSNKAWTTSRDKKGVNLYVKTPAGLRAAQDSKGKPIFKSFEEMIKEKRNPSETSHDRIKRIFGGDMGKRSRDPSSIRDISSILRVDKGAEDAFAKVERFAKKAEQLDAESSALFKKSNKFLLSASDKKELRHFSDVAGFYSFTSRVKAEDEIKRNFKELYNTTPSVGAINYIIETLAKGKKLLSDEEEK